MIGVLVLAVVGIGRLFSDEGSVSPFTKPVSPAPMPSINANHDDDGVVDDDEPPPSLTASPGTAEPEAVAYAFASSWVDHENVSAKSWHDGLVPNTTETLAQELNGVDPAGVPANRVLGRPILTPISDDLANAVVTVDSGKLTLQLVAPDGRWLVNSVDWDAS